MNRFDKLSFHPLVRDFVNSHATIMAAYLGWRLVGEEVFSRLLVSRGGDDRVGVAVEADLGAGHHISFSFDKSVRPVVTDTDDHLRACSFLSQQLVGHCYEILSENNLLPRHDLPIAEFFRHVRNGCYHGNRFNLHAGQPKNPAEWRGLRIDASLNDTTVFRSGKDARDYFLNFGDPVVLLHDLSTALSPTVQRPVS